MKPGKLWRQIGLVVLCGLLVGCARRPAPSPDAGAVAPPPKPLGPPLFDSRRGGGAFPYLGAEFPADVTDLTEGMEAAYAQRLIPPTPGLRAVRLTADRLFVDVSGWRVRPEYEPVQFDRRTDPAAVWHVAQVAYVAEPLEYERGAVSVRLLAEGAELHGVRDKGQVGIVLAGARSGELHFSASLDDFNRVFTAGARRGAGRAGVRIAELSLQVTTPDPRTVAAEMHMSGSWLLLPMRMTISGRMHVDDTLHGHFEAMTVHGEGPAGEFLAPFVARALRRLEERRSPLMAFRDDKTVATDFAARATDRFEVRIAFARPPEQPPARPAPVTVAVGQRAPNRPNYR